jgi:linoleoyl-CoA desaturase
MSAAQKLHFSKAPANDIFISTLTSRVKEQLTDRKLSAARRLLWLKFVLYTAVFLGLYYCLITIHGSYPLFTLLFAGCGLSGIMLAFNCGHDAVHGSFSKSKTANFIISTFAININGVSSLLWRKRHLASHHIFPNVDGCDADIDDNPFLRISPHQLWKSHFRFQHLYAPFIYSLYTLQWVFYKDLFYLRKEELANMRGLNYSMVEILGISFWKSLYLSMYIVVPLAAGYPLSWVLSGFLVMHIAISHLFILTLAISHLCMETEFPQAENGYIAHNYYYHQLLVSMDYDPESRIANFMLGGFNCHAAHHLFPRVPHTLYRDITATIQQTTREQAYPYNVLPTGKAIASHFKYLYTVGQKP